MLIDRRRSNEDDPRAVGDDLRVRNDLFQVRLVFV
jgi:hypothetical protein